MRLVAAFAAGALVSGLAVYFVIERRGRLPAPAPEPVAVQAPAETPPPSLPVAPAAAEPKPAPRAAASTKARKSRTAAAEPAPETKPEPGTEQAEVAAATPPSPPAAAAPTPTPAPAPEPVKPEPAREPHKVTLPPGTLITVRLSERLASDRNAPGDSFTATLDEPLVADGFVIAERGARVEGRIASVQESGRVKGVATLALQLVRLQTADGQLVEISTDPFEKKASSEKMEDAAKVGVGAAIGAAIGAIAGGGKGAAIGAGVGGAAGGGTVLATRGKPAVLAPETRITFRLNSPVTIVEKL